MTDTPDQGQGRTRAADEAVAEIVDLDGAVVTRWFVVAEILDEDGDQALFTCHSNRLATWDQLGLLGFATERVRRHVQMTRSREDDEE